MSLRGAAGNLGSERLSMDSAHTNHRQLAAARSNDSNIVATHRSLTFGDYIHFSVELSKRNFI